MKKLFYVVTFLIGFALNGFVLVDLWAWFVLPLGAPTVSFAHAIGLDLLVTYVVQRRSDVEPTKKKKQSEAERDTEIQTRLVVMLTRSLVAWCVGYVAHLGMVGWP